MSRTVRLRRRTGCRRHSWAAGSPSSARTASRAACRVGISRPRSAAARAPTTECSRSSVSMTLTCSATRRALDLVLLAQGGGQRRLRRQHTGRDQLLDRGLQPARSPRPAQRSSNARSRSSPRVPTTQTVSPSPIAAHATAPATVSPGARSASSRLSVNATPNPKPAPTSIISRVSSRRDFSCGAREVDRRERCRCRRVDRQAQALRDVGQMRGGAVVHLGNHLVEANTGVGLELRQFAPGQARGVLLQLRAHRGTAIAGEVGQLNPSLLGLAAQRDRALGLGQPSLPQDRRCAARATRRPAPAGPRRRRRGRIGRRRSAVGIPMPATCFVAEGPCRRAGRIPRRRGRRRVVRRLGHGGDPDPRHVAVARCVRRQAPRGRRPGHRPSCGARRSWTPRRSPRRSRRSPRRADAQSDSVNVGGRRDDEHHRRRRLAGRQVRRLDEPCSGSRSLSAATTPVTPASHGPVTSTASRRLMIGAPSRGPIAATIASTSATESSSGWSVTPIPRPSTTAAANP